VAAQGHAEKRTVNGDGGRVNRRRLPAQVAHLLREAIFLSIPEADYFDDVHGSALYKRHLTYYFAEQIRGELADGASP